MKKIGTEERYRILGCPICGSTPELIGDQDGDAATQVYIECSRCRFRTPVVTAGNLNDQLITGYRKPAAAVIALWNTRRTYDEYQCGGYSGHPYW